MRIRLHAAHRGGAQVTPLPAMIDMGILRIDKGNAAYFYHRH